MSLNYKNPKPIRFLVLFLFFLGCKSISHQEEPISLITIHAIGDSTMANKPSPEVNPERGWVQVLPQFFNERVVIHNHAVNGRSSKSFRDLGHWQPVLEVLTPGDYVIIQFGHNDAKETDPVRYTNPQTTYRYNIIRYVEEVRETGAIPIICSSIARRKFNEEGVLLDSHGNYTLMARLVAAELGVLFIDMQYLTEQLEVAYGVEGSKRLHLHYAPGEHPYYPEGITDNTHLSELGAIEIAKLYVEELLQKEPRLSKYLANILR
jgi:lysophospholipase L1-like esterase